MRRKQTTGSLAVTRWDLWLGGVVFCAAVAIGALFVFVEYFWSTDYFAPALFAVFLLMSLYRRGLMRLVRALGDRIVGEPVVLTRPWVIDGDTIRDLVSGVRYRFANADAPETGDNAKCFHERSAGERAKWAAVNIVRDASRVEVRKTMRRDRHGRTVAYVYADGVDLGETLMKMGLAYAWSGYRKRWCGPSGPLVQMATIRGEHHACATCANWR